MKYARNLAYVISMAKGNNSLLYLMVLIDSHTISKSIDNDEKVDDIFDSINELDHTRNPKLRRDRFLHKYKSDFKDEFVRPLDALRETKQCPETIKTTEKTTLKSTSEHTKHHKSPKRRVGSFWRKFRGKNKKNKNNDAKERERRIPKNRELAWRYPATNRKSGPRNKSRRKNRNQFVLRQPEINFAKRDATENILFSSRESYSPTNQKPPNKMRIGITPQLNNIVKPYIVKTSLHDETRERLTDNYEKLLASMTTEINHLKQLYGLEKFNPTTYAFPPFYEKSTQKLSSFITRPSTSTTTEKSVEYEFPGTAQIEELLNDIKVKAIQMVAEQNPAVTDIITNTVTEATFEADPILTHIDTASPGYYLSTFVSINDIENVYGKRTVEPTRTNEFKLNDSVLITNTESHYLVARSIKEDTMTIARNVEDMLQRELKNVFNKVKNKISSDFRKEVHKAKTTMKEGITKICSKPTTKAKETPAKPCKTTCVCKNYTVAETTIATTASRHSRGEHKNKQNKHGTTQQSTSPTSTYDDYMMLTLYEQMLAKTHEENVMKMLSTADATVKKRREHFKLSKRNAETLTDVKLREDIQKIYDDEMNMPDYDYIEPSTMTHTEPTDHTETLDIVEGNDEPVSSVDSTGKISDSTGTIQSESPQLLSSITQSSIDDTSYEGLSNKISYNDFVNGYRHYLKFQKEQGSQNFSNLIKYQAHRHHSVDDIGKFILEKIPPLRSNKRRKRFFDDSDIDYQEISTKGDDSWFKKHFYLFVDNGPPKKYHTSQTVSLKSAITDSELKLFSMDDTMIRPAHKGQVFIKIGSENGETTKKIKDTAYMSLDDLSRILDSIKDKQTTRTYYRNDLSTSPKDQESSTIRKHYNSTDNVNLKIIPQGLIGKLFGGKRRRTPKKLRDTTEYDPDLELEIFTENLGKRFRRTVTKEDEDSTIMDELMNKDLDEKTSTTTKETFTDNTIRSNKEPNKYGYVDIDLVPRQTAIVKLRENTSKKSRFKDFFKKFHFKKGKNKKQSKRQCMYYTRRRARFNPIKKLRDMFKIRSEDRIVTSGFHVPNMIPDYEMMTSHIDTFKPIKYVKPLSIDEMKKQIPNISEVVNFDSETSTTKSPGSPTYLFKLDEKDQNLLFNYHLSLPTLTTMKLKGFAAPILNVKQSTDVSRTKTPKSTTTLFTKRRIPPSNVMTVNVKTLRPIQTTTSRTTSKVSTPETTAGMTLNDMHIILNKLQYKLTTARNFPNLSTQFHKRGTMGYTRIRQPVQCRRPLEELMIKSKLTRIAKFPISKRHFKNRVEDIQSMDNDYIGFQEEPIIKEYRHEMRHRNVFPEKKRLSKLGANMKKVSKSGVRSSNSVKNFESEKCRYTDYFNDLLMWHNDILNLDKVPSPLWKNILQNIQSEASYTTPNMNNLIKELNEMNEFMDEETSMPNRLVVTTKINSPPTAEATNATNTQGGIRSVPVINKQPVGVIRSVAMDDKAFVTCDDLLIKGEAKYFQYNKPNVIEGRDVLSRGFNTLIGYDKRQKARIQDKDKALRSYSSSDNEEPAILVDTTLLAYDDEADSVTKGLEVKKLSRNSQDSAIKAANKPPNSPLLKTNKAPLQYYTTPLPMKPYEFEKFLKDNKMDVESVTSPIFEIPTPTFIQTWTPKTTKTPTSKVYDIKPTEENPITKENENTKKVELTTQKLMKTDKLTTQTAAPVERGTLKLIVKPRPLLLSRNIPNNNRTFDDVDRYKRYSELNKIYPRNYVTFRPFKTTEINYYNMIKKKMKLFEKKATGSDKLTQVFSLDPRNKEVEITIINFDDIDKMPATFKAYDSFSMPQLKKEETTYDEFAERPEMSDTTTKTIDYFSQKDIPDAMHNELLYKDIFKERTTSTTTEFTALEFPKNTEDSESTTTEQFAAPLNNKLHYPFEFLYKMPHSKSMDLPQRVHISSHHYKYDIFYNEDKKTKAGLDGLRPKQSANTPTVPTIMIPRVKATRKRAPAIFRKGEDSTDIRHDRSRKRTCNRQARDVTSTIAMTETATEAPPGSLVYDLKHLKLTSINPRKERRRRLFKISKLLQHTFKNFLKNTTSSTTAATTILSKRRPKLNTYKCTCKVLNDTTTESDEEEREEAKGEGFQVTCEPEFHETTTLATTTTEVVVHHHHHHYHHHHHTTADRAREREREREREEEAEAEVEDAESRPETTSVQSCVKVKGHVFKDLPNDTLYVEPENYEQAYYESGPMHPPPTGCPNEAELHSEKKRDIQTAQQNTFTAKDVAALEVIVDLMKNTLSYEEKDLASVFSNLVQPHATKSAPHCDTTNSIQVHIALPVDFQTGKKRSPLDPVRVRKVFSAKMSTPVDLEYQVHSFEGTIGVTDPSIDGKQMTDEGLSPGMYLLVDKPKNGFALKPVKAQIDLSDLRTRQAGTTASMTEAKPTETRDETTSLKSLAKVTLSKDFIAAVNKQLIDLYENMTGVNMANRKTRNTRSVWISHKSKEEQEKSDTKQSAKNFISKRHIDWEAVKKYFGHDRVCNCKCKANKAMCRACAASDAVIEELIFEFDNLGNYMKDHCTEIQTFFWMNPSGGQKLRDSVNRIDKSLSDYYKRVKGKCQGRTCKTFATYIDKRHIVKTAKVPKEDPVTHVIKDLSAIAEDLNKTVTLTACFNHKLKEEGEKFLHAINNCMLKKSFHKRSNPNSTKKKLIKNVYSLDNINVNIICNPEVTTTSEGFDPPSTSQVTHTETTQRVGEHLFDYEIDENKHKKRKGFKKLFPRKNRKDKLFTYYVTGYSKKPKPHFKRDIENRASPLIISDGGGAFWYEYLKGSTNEPRVVRESSKDSSKSGVAVIRKDVTTPKIQKAPEKKIPTLNNMYMTIKTSSKREIQSEENTESTTDYLTHNINQLLQLFGSLQDIESMNMHSNRSTMFLTHKATDKTTDKKKNKKLKTKSSTKNVKIIKNHPKANVSDTDSPNVSTTLSEPNSEAKLEPKTESKLEPKTEPKLEPKTESNIEPNVTDEPTHPLDSPKITDPTSQNSTTAMTPDSSSIITESNEDAATKALTTESSLKQTDTGSTENKKLDLNAEVKKLSDIGVKKEKNEWEPFFSSTDTKETTQVTTENFLGKLKTGALKFFDNVGKGYVSDDDTTITSVTERTSSTSIINRISDTELNLTQFEESSQMTTRMSPTIVIINEYDNQISNDCLVDSNKNSEGYKNLLLSIIQYESNRLNDEWHKIAYGSEKDKGGGGSEKDDGDYKRSILDLKRESTKFYRPKTVKPKVKCMDEYDVIHGFKAWTDLQIPEPKETKKPLGLLNKIANKIGMKIVSDVSELTKKKKAAKRTKSKTLILREVTRKLKKKKNKKIKEKAKNLKNASASFEEACDTRRKPKSSEICDIQATYEHILDLQKILSPKHFESVVKNISCYKYKRVERSFFIPYKSKGKKWDWIRNKRSLKIHFSKFKDETEFGDEIAMVDFDNDYDLFEKFVKGDDGIYKIVKRRKRTVGLNALELGLRNIPPLVPAENELFAMVGDSITLDCFTPQTVVPYYVEKQFIWKADRKNMLELDNVEVSGVKVTIRNVEPKNLGRYICSQDNEVQRNVKVNVMTIPAFDVVFVPIYKTQRECNYEDLKAIQRLGVHMSEEAGCGNACSVRIDEPVCQKDRGTNSSLIRSTAVISMNTHRVNCSVQCRRDLVSSLVMLCAANTPTLSSVEVVISKDGINNTMTPCNHLVRPVTTRSLRKKDSNGHHEYRKLVSSLTPGKVDVVLICPAGYYLIQEHKICGSCPPNTSASLGDNTCRTCPHGTRSEPGAARCYFVGTEPRRYDWWWYPPCGYLVACGSLVCGCGVCVALAMLVHVTSRDPPANDMTYDGKQKAKMASGLTAAFLHTPHTRPLSPSRVILARFFKPSLTSSRATDSQETKFELWKEQNNRPPPLPPIDFDI